MFTELTPVESMFHLGDTTDRNALPLTERELLVLAVLALKAADDAREHGDFAAMERLCVLAKKCDCHAEIAQRDHRTITGLETTVRQ